MLLWVDSSVHVIHGASYAYFRNMLDLLFFVVPSWCSNHISSDGHGWPLLLLLQTQDREQDRAIRGGEIVIISRDISRYCDQSTKHHHRMTMTWQMEEWRTRPAPRRRMLDVLLFGVSFILPLCAVWYILCLNYLKCQLICICPCSLSTNQI